MYILLSIHLPRYALAKTKLALYLGNAIGTFGGKKRKKQVFEVLISCTGTLPPVCKIIIARVVDSSELGKLNTFVTLLEALIPLAFVPVFDRLWIISADKLPGLDFLVTAGIFGIIFILLVIVCGLLLKSEK